VDRKPIPPPSLELLLFPATDTEYVHFENAASLPFDDGARYFSPVNAWWMADAALLAYWDAPRAKPIWARAGLQFELLSEGGTQCHVAWSDRFVIVAFRGTQPNDVRDLFTDFQVEHADWEFGGGQVHSGFRAAHRQIWPLVEKRLNDLASGRTVWFTGHSLGAALATLSMDRFENAAGLFTIGSPPVGDRRFARGFNHRHAGRNFRYVNHHDIIVWLPGMLAFLLGSYNHVQERKYINAQGKHSGGLFFRDWSALVTALLTSRSLMRRLLEAPHETAPLLPLPGPLVDHTPRRYAIQVWNALVDSAGVVVPARA
jgi:hypothetical protein